MAVENSRKNCGGDQLEYERCLCLHFPAEAALQSIECSSFEPIYWYHPDYLGHTDFVTDRTGQPYQHFFYAPFGEALLSQHTGTGYYNTPYRFNAKELDSETGLIYYGARYYEPKESVWLSMDPILKPNENPYASFSNNPIRFVDLDGKDTLDILLDSKGWKITNAQCAEGDDIFRISHNGKISSYNFSGGKYGSRLNVLNLESTTDYTLGVFHISGAAEDKGGVGFYVTPGGEPSTKFNSNRRLPTGEYDLVRSYSSSIWEMPWVISNSDKEVGERGIKWHPALSRNAVGWTKGCFVISNDYEIGSGCTPIFNPAESIQTAINFSQLLGASSTSEKHIKGHNRIVAKFNKVHLGQVNLKNAF